MQRDELLDYIHNIFLVKQRVDEEVAAQTDLSPLEVHMINFVKMHSDDPTAAGMERKHRIKKNTISVHVENLVQGGYLVRQNREGDRRKVILTLTDKGEEIARRTYERSQQVGRMLSRNLTEQELQSMIKCFRIVSDNALELLNKPLGSKEEL